MAIHSLLKHCMRIDNTSIKENSRSTSIARKQGEIVVLFETDNDEFREAFDLIGKKCSDGVFYYKKMTVSAPSILMFVELSGGGKKATISVEQLKNVVKALRSVLIGCFGESHFRWKAAVVGTDGGTVLDQSKFQEDFRENLKTTLKFFSHERLDLRELLR